MVVTAGRNALALALIVPDEQTWTLSGDDPAASGLRPVFEPAVARRLLVPKVLPSVLADALEARLAELPPDVRVEQRALPLLDGRPAPDAIGSREEHHGREGGEQVHAEHHGDHGDMMAIVGEPSADGLVMEPIAFRFGPLATPLPGGLAVDVTLDGDVVAESDVHALLSAAGPTKAVAPPPDLLAPMAWTLVIEAAAGRLAISPWRRVAVLEVERAVSHLAWLRALGRLLGWRLLVDRCSLALEGVPALATGLADADEEDREACSRALSVLQEAYRRASSVAALVGRSRVLRWRSAGIGVVKSDHARHLGLRGPVARASGLRQDAREGNALYARLGFEPVVHPAGDAHARTLVRAEEARTSLRLAGWALRAEADGDSVAPRLAEASELEGPRGPLTAERGVNGWALTAAGARQAVRAAGDAMVGAEWSDALVALASFDLSPWRVGT